MSLESDLRDFGTPATNIRWLDSARWDNVDYRDLVNGISLERGGNKDIRPAAVVEANHEPLLYVIPANLVPQDSGSITDAVTKLRIKLSARGRGAYVALSEPGKLTLYSVGLGPYLPPPITRIATDMESTSLFSELAAGLIEQGTDAQQKAADRAAFHNKLFGLLTEASNQLLALPVLAGRTDDVVSLIGRALFARFLIDRGVLTAIATGAPALDCFATVSNAAATCEWMDEIFNGDLLELSGKTYVGFFRQLGARSEAFQVLTDIVKGQPGRQAEFPMWDDIDFSHVPVGLLSEVYEKLAHQHADEHAAAESIHYTPRNIAAYMVDQAFLGLSKEQRAKAKCLDPASGGGVFLVLCYRRLVAERWEADGKQPSRKVLREIIDQQIRGFDINDSALKLAALSLYLSAIELDPDPAKAGDRKFKPMRGRVLISARAEDEPHPNSFVLGSLGPMISTRHRGQYQIVISNPPWSSWERRKAGRKVDLLNDTARDLTRRIATEKAANEIGDVRERLLSIAANYENRDAVPDLAFAWRAVEWAAPEGVIALALHARLLFQPNDDVDQGRNALFSAVRVTGILNGSALRKRQVWPNIAAQWCLLFALNRLPADTDQLYYVNPELDPAINDRGRMRIDYHNAEPIELGVLRKKPYLLKTLFRGTSIDVSILERILRVGTTLGSYLKQRGVVHGDGYQAALNTESGKLKDCPELFGLPNLSSKTWSGGHSVDVSQLPPFKLRKVRRSKSRDLFRGPLLIIPESISPDRNSRGAVIATEDVVFSESFYGYSAANYKGGEPIHLIRYLHVLSYSALLYHFTLMVSSKFGIERDLMNKVDLDSFPVVPFENLSAADRNLAQSLSKAIEAGSADFLAVDRWVAKIYGLSDRDVDALRDALDTAMPFTASQSRAIARTDVKARQDFAAVLEELLPPLFEMIDRKVHIALLETTTSAWKFITISERQELPQQWASTWIEGLAEDEGASAVFVHHDGHLIIGLRDQYRYWTKSRARLCGHEIVSKHADLLFAGHPE